MIKVMDVVLCVGLYFSIQFSECSFYDKFKVNKHVWYGAETLDFKDISFLLLCQKCELSSFKNHKTRYEEMLEDSTLSDDCRQKIQKKMGECASFIKKSEALMSSVPLNPAMTDEEIGALLPTINQLVHVGLCYRCSYFKQKI